MSFGSKVRPRTFGCVAIGSAVLSGVNRVQVVLFGFSVRLFGFVQTKMYVCLGCTCACVCRCNGDVICVDHDLNLCSGWWYVCRVNVK